MEHRAKWPQDGECSAESGLVKIGSRQPIERYCRVHFWLPCGSLKGNHENMDEDKWKPAAHISIQSVRNRDRYRVFVIVCGRLESWELRQAFVWTLRYAAELCLVFMQKFVQHVIIKWHVVTWTHINVDTKGKLSSKFQEDPFCRWKYAVNMTNGGISEGMYPSTAVRVCVKCGQQKAAWNWRKRKKIATNS